LTLELDSLNIWRCPKSKSRSRFFCLRRCLDKTSLKIDRTSILVTTEMITLHHSLSYGSPLFQMPVEVFFFVLNGDLWYATNMLVFNREAYCYSSD